MLWFVKSHSSLRLPPSPTSKTASLCKTCCSGCIVLGAGSANTQQSRRNEAFIDCFFHIRKLHRKRNAFQLTGRFPQAWNVSLRLSFSKSGQMGLDVFPGFLLRINLSPEL